MYVIFVADNVKFPADVFVPTVVKLIRGFFLSLFLSVFYFLFLILINIFSCIHVFNNNVIVLYSQRCLTRFLNVVKCGFNNGVFTLVEPLDLFFFAIFKIIKILHKFCTNINNFESVYYRHTLGFVSRQNRNRCKLF